MHRGICAAAEVLPLRTLAGLANGLRRTVVVYGTSLSHEGAWCRTMADWFECKYPGLVSFINAAQSGKDSGWGLAHLEERVLRHCPDLVFLEFAVNDANEENNHVGLVESTTNQQDMVEALRECNPGVEIVMQIMNPLWEHPVNRNLSKRPRLLAYEAIPRRLALHYGLGVLDHGPVWMEFIALDAARLETAIPDGTHPTAAASMTVSWPAVERFLLRAENMLLGAG